MATPCSDPECGTRQHHSDKHFNTFACCGQDNCDCHEATFSETKTNVGTSFHVWWRRPRSKQLHKEQTTLQECDSNTYVFRNGLTIVTNAENKVTRATKDEDSVYIRGIKRVEEARTGGGGFLRF